MNKKPKTPPSRPSTPEHGILLEWINFLDAKACALAGVGRGSRYFAKDSDLSVIFFPAKQIYVVVDDSGFAVSHFHTNIVASASWLSRLKCTYKELPYSKDEINALAASKLLSKSMAAQFRADVAG